MMTFMRKVLWRFHTVDLNCSCNKCRRARVDAQVKFLKARVPDLVSQAALIKAVTNIQAQIPTGADYAANGLMEIIVKTLVAAVPLIQTSADPLSRVELDDCLRDLKSAQAGYEKHGSRYIWR
jgi:hypothetical protein